MKNVLFLCTGNSCRSQMAEGLCRHLYSGQINSFSAGTEIHGLNPLAVEVMQEIDIDISNQQSTLFQDFNDVTFDLIVTVCDSAAKKCSLLSLPKTVIHHSFDDPPFLAKHTKNKSDALVHFRRVRNDIKKWMEVLPLKLANEL